MQSRIHISVPVIRATMMETEMVPETSALLNQLTRLKARENFVVVCRRKNFTSHTHTHTHSLKYCMKFKPEINQWNEYSLCALYTQTCINEWAVMP